PRSRPACAGSPRIRIWGGGWAGPPGTDTSRASVRRSVWSAWRTRTAPRSRVGQHWLAAGTPARAGGMGTADDTMPTLRLGSAGERRRSGGDAAVRELPRRAPTGSAGARVPAASAGLHRLLARADPSADHAGGDVQG